MHEGINDKTWVNQKESVKVCDELLMFANICNIAR